MSTFKWKPYPEYRVIPHAGIEEIPNHWDSKRMRYVFTERGEVSEDGTEELLSVSKYTGVKVRSTITDREARAASLVGYKKCEPNDMVSNIMLAWDSALGVAFDSGIVSSAYEVYVPQQEINPHFLDLLLRTPEYRVAFTIVSKGIVPSRWRMYTESFNDIQMILPPLNEQKQIGSFVHRINENISKNIQNLEAQISLVEEKRSALITQAVTKGLNPDVLMKNSGVDWIGAIPDSWVVGKIKHFCRNLNYKRLPLSAEDRSYRQGKYDYYGASGVIDHIDDYLFDEPTVLIAEDGANLVLRNLPLAIFAEGKYWVNNHAHILKPNDGAYRFWCELLESQDFNPYVSGSAQPKLTAESIMNYIVAIPNDKKERFAIEDYTISTNSIYIPLIRKLREKITLLHEYRTSLISAAVTGKIDVRGL